MIQDCRDLVNRINELAGTKGLLHESAARLPQP